MWWPAAIALLILVMPNVAAGQPADRVARIALLRSESRLIDERLKRNFAALRVINLKTARGLGLALPPALLLRADHVIE